MRAKVWCDFYCDCLRLFYDCFAAVLRLIWVYFDEQQPAWEPLPPFCALLPSPPEAEDLAEVANAAVRPGQEHTQVCVLRRGALPNRKPSPPTLAKGAFRPT